MPRFPWPLLAAGLVTASATSGGAQTQQDWREAGGAAEPFTLEQGYHGTRPGDGNRLPRVEELRGKPGGWVTWPGFLMREDGGSRVFLQTTRPLQYRRSAGKLRFTLHFEDAKVHLNNNRNPLVTAFFNTPVKRAWLKRRGKNVDLVVELKQAAAEAVTQFSDNDGYHYLFIDFPPGDYPRGAGFAPRPATVGGGSWSSGGWGYSGSGGYYSQVSGGQADGADPADGGRDASLPDNDIDLDYGTNAPDPVEPPPDE
jgi:hypothetical protein